jgi:hypothetical protein
MSIELEHQRAIELLPWYVNGTLSEPERERVDAHVRHCVPCRLALREQRELQTVVREHPAVHVSAERGFDRLMRRIDGTSGSARDKAWASGHRLAIAASIVLAFTALGATVYVASNLRAPADEFRTLANGTAERGARIDVIFTEGVTENAMRELIRAFGASLVAGPSEAGRYTIEVRGTRGADELERTLATLNEDPRVRFAGRSYIGAQERP